MLVEPATSDATAVHAQRVSAASNSRTQSVVSMLSASLPAKPEIVDEVVALSFGTRVLIWFTIVFLMLFNGALLSAWTYVYATNNSPDSLLLHLRLYYLFSNGVTFLVNWSTTVAIGYALLAFVFFMLVARIVWLSIRERDFQLSSRLATSRFGSFGHAQAAVHKLQSTHVVRRLLKAYDKFHHLFGVRGAYFELRLLAEEYMEMITMTLAAYSASSSISNVPLNVIFGVVIFINGISSTVIRRVFRGSLLKQRIACLLTDLVIDFVWGTVIPMWMWLPILRVYKDRANVLENIASFASSTREIERVIILSWPYYVLSVIPFFNSFSNLVEVENIMREISTPPTSNVKRALGSTVAAKQTGGTKVVDAPAPQHEEKAVVDMAAKQSEGSMAVGAAASTSMMEGTKKPSDGRTFIHLVYPVGRFRHGPVMRLAHLLMPLCGLAVLLTVLAANGVFKTPPSNNLSTCIHRVYPWLSTKEACLGRRVNCTAIGIRGTAPELIHTMEIFDESSLSDLFLLSCPQLEIPPKIHDFRHLMSFIIVDATLVEWGEDAALTAAFVPELRTIHMIGVTLVHTPLGIVGAQPISPSVEWIHLESINAAELLTMVDDKWESLLSIECVYCGLTTFPAMLYKMQRLATLALAHNDIDSIPTDWRQDMDSPLQVLWFDTNPRLTTVPDTLWRYAETIVIFDFRMTNLSHVPEWVADVAGPAFSVLAIDTPVCSGAAAVDPRVKHLVVCS